LEREYSRLLPSLKALVEKEKAKHDNSANLNRTLGFSQAFEYGKRSNEEYVRHYYCPQFELISVIPTPLVQSGYQKLKTISCG